MSTILVRSSKLESVSIELKSRSEKYKSITSLKNQQVMDLITVVKRYLSLGKFWGNF